MRITIKALPLALAAILIIAGSCNNIKITKEDINIIPQPRNIEHGNGYFKINGRTSIACDTTNSEIFQIAKILQERINTGGDVYLMMDVKTTRNNYISLELCSDTSIGNEGYKLSVNKKSVILKANKPAGLFYGIQTILQLFPADIYCKNKVENLDMEIPCVKISDSPEFSWRGMHLDVSRHFFPVEFIKKYIDIIAFHKMNIFHWHLTDDNGWRIEIKKYPDLTNISAWRVDREDKPWREREPQKEGEVTTYGGFYTQDEIREIVEYAQRRYVRIIPEIEMPGHTSEVFAAYPQYSCTGKMFTVRPGSYWPNREIFCAGNDSVFTFIQDILSEVADLFPFEYIHVGGDEADKKRWEECPKCQKRIKSEHLTGEKELQSYFIKRIEEFLISKNKKLVGWDEILEGGIAPEATVMSWRGIEGGIEATTLGHDVIMCPGNYCYFDHYQADPETQPVAIGGFTDLEKVYSFNPVPEGLSETEQKHIIGAQGNVWTEFISTSEHAEYMALPRMTALAEILWTPSDKQNYNDFRKRLDKQFFRFDFLNINYCKDN